MKKIPIAVAAELLDQSRDFVRISIRQGRFPIGSCVKMTGRYVYDIRPERLADYMGITISELYTRIEQEKIIKTA